MKKLTVAEIDALAIEISKELREIKQAQRDKENEVKLEKFYKTSLGKKVKILLDVEETEYLINMHTVEQLAGCDTKYASVDTSAIRRQIILQQIDCKDMENLINNVKKYMEKNVE